MAKTFTLLCDGCGKKSTDKAVVEQVRMVRSDGSSWTMDLCDKCFRGLVDQYEAEPTQKRARSGYRPTTVDEVRRKATRKPTE